MFSLEILPLYFTAFLIWNLGFWVRVKRWFGGIKMGIREKICILVGVPISQIPVEIAGVMFQIAAYLLSIGAYILSVFAQDRALRAGIFALLLWPSFLGGLKLARFLGRYSL